LSNRFLVMIPTTIFPAELYLGAKARWCSLVAYCRKETTVNGINIYVGNISFKTDDESLKDLFERYGQVEMAKVIMDRATGRSRGFGFVEMLDREAGLKAIQELDSQDFMGRSLKVNEARPRKGPF
jgi:RNA recognition motif-containing protein